LDVKLTILRHGSLIGKMFVLGPDGELKKQSQGRFFEGTAEVVAAPTAKALAELLEGLGPRDVLTLGIPRDGLREAKVVTESRRGPGEISRTGAFFEFRPGPGWILIDSDTKTMPVDVAERVEALGGIEGALVHTWPDLARAARVVRPSSSAAVRIAGQPAPASAASTHVFVLVRDVSRSAAILQTLQRRAFAAGLGWIAISRSGAALQRLQSPGPNA
jgi:hypothetical protein